MSAARGPARRVLVVPKWYPTPARPAFGAFCRDHALALSTRNEVVVMASYALRNPPFACFAIEERIEDGLRTIRIRYRRMGLRAGALLCQAAGMLEALRRLRHEGFDPQVIHAHVYSAGLPALLLGRICRAPVVVSEHYTGFARGLIGGYERVLARIAFEGADLVAPVSADLAAQLRPIAPAARYAVVPNAVDTDLFYPARLGQGASGHSGSSLIAVGALARKKGHLHLLEALALMRRREPERDLRLTLVGDGELSGELRAAARALGLQERVRFLGEQERTGVAEAMRSADLLVLPSLHENLPCVLLEALASGLPFVASAVGGIPELLADEPVRGACRIAQPGNPQALAGAISEALARSERIDRERLAGYARARFGYDAVAQRWETIYGMLR
ncbi:MAG TPA: glycosyltransferase [Solirubrobacteraceae bacterium]|nr:glycosyltransferase [Solirubrobacteraceae bacterium]